MIKFVYFDLGNVLVGFSHRRACEQLANCCRVSVDDVRELLFHDELQQKYETGMVDTLQLCDEIRNRLGSNASSEAIINSISDIFWPIPETVALMAGLIRSGVRVGVLSNTCHAHWHQVTTAVYRWLPARLDQCVLSYEVGCTKPDAGIFRTAIERTGLLPNEIFFMDDIPENVEGALQSGIKGVQYTTTTRLYRDLLRELSAART